MSEACELGVIREARLGFEDHGILTFFLEIDFGGHAQGFGGYTLGGGFTDACLRGILEAVGVFNWHELAGKTVWVTREDGLIQSIEAPRFVAHKGPFNAKAEAEKWKGRLA